MTTTVDSPTDVRTEDAFDVTAVTNWLLKVSRSELRSQLDGEPEVKQFPRGASNLTYLLRWPDIDLILRRPPVGTKAKGAHNMKREHDIQAALHPHFTKVPAMVGHCADNDVIGDEFYVMERLVGTILRTDLPEGLELPADAAARLCDSALDTLVELHEVDLSAAPDLAALDRGAGYVERQVAGWTKRYDAARTDDAPTFSEVTRWLADNQPADRPHTLIHNDFRLDNLVLNPDNPTAIMGVLDWELATVGDPLMDLGGAMAYWIQADDDATVQNFRLQPTHLPGMLSRADMVAGYCERRGVDLSADEWAFYEVFGLFRLAVIAQQIYYRFYHGQTTNPWFASFGPMASYLETRCLALIH